MFKAGNDIEDMLMDRVNEILLRFAHQYKDDNKDISYAKPFSFATCTKRRKKFK